MILEYEIEVHSRRGNGKNCDTSEVDESHRSICQLGVRLISGYAPKN